ncbi:hypothetical protein SAMN03159284_02494 [Mucilaginibacter sp. NFR10]|nr:hypothetical protein SAMN03159284_02494 [Mucilaginibacter sp. NFR10]
MPGGRSLLPRGMQILVRIDIECVLTPEVFGRNRKSEGLCDSLPWEGVGRGFNEIPDCCKAYKPLPATTKSSRTPPKGGN